MQLSEKQKRWLEIIFYLICNKIFILNNSTQDVINFISGMLWTNLYKCDKLIDTITKNKILIDPQFIPTKRELLLVLSDEEIQQHFKIDSKTIKVLIEETKYAWHTSEIFRIKMQEEVNPTTIYARLTDIHNDILQFIVSYKYMSNIFKNIIIKE